MYAFDKFDPVTKRWVADDETARKRFSDATVTAGVVRWNSNNSVPPQDVLEQWASLGLPFDLKKSVAARDADLTKFTAAYRKAQRAAPRDPEFEAEMAFERRAAFGPGVTVVDVNSGRKYRT